MDTFVLHRFVVCDHDEKPQETELVAAEKTEASALVIT